MIRMREEQYCRDSSLNQSKESTMRTKAADDAAAMMIRTKSKVVVYPHLRYSLNSEYPP